MSAKCVWQKTFADGLGFTLMCLDLLAWNTGWAVDDYCRTVQTIDVPLVDDSQKFDRHDLGGVTLITASESASRETLHGHP